MKKYIKKTIIFFVIIILITSFLNTVFASGFVGDFKGESTGQEDKIKAVVSEVLGTVRLVGSGVAALILIVLGCKYMLASAGERAEIKKYATTYIIGAVVFFASASLVSLVKSFVDASLPAV